MTNEEKDRLIAYLVDAGEIDPEGDVEAQFLEWRQVHEQVVSGEVHYKAILVAAALVMPAGGSHSPEHAHPRFHSLLHLVSQPGGFAASRRHPGGPTTRYSVASASVFFTAGIVFSLLHAGFFMPALRRKSFRSFIYVETDYLIFNPFSGSRPSLFVFCWLLVALVVISSHFFGIVT